MQPSLQSGSRILPSAHWDPSFPLTVNTPFAPSIPGNDWLPISIDLLSLVKSVHWELSSKIPRQSPSDFPTKVYHQYLAWPSQGLAEIPNCLNFYFLPRGVGGSAKGHSPSPDQTLPLPCPSILLGSTVASAFQAGKKKCSRLWYDDK